jgi:hypothetical protein
LHIILRRKAFWWGKNPYETTKMHIDFLAIKMVLYVSTDKYNKRVLGIQVEES